MSKGQTSHIGQWWCQVILMISLLIVGMAADNLFTFWLEDYFHDPLEGSIYFGYEYATSASWLIVSFILFSICQCLQWWLAKRNPGFYEKRRRKIFLASAITYFGVVCVVLIATTLYSFFNGTSTTGAFLRVLVSLGLLVLGLLYCVYEMRMVSERPVIYKVLLFISIGVIVLGALIVMFTCAPPVKVREMRADKQRVTDIRKTATNILAYYKRHKELPATLSDLPEQQAPQVKKYGVSSTIALSKKQYDYHPEGKKTFRICADFAHTHQDARRLHGRFFGALQYEVKYQAGKQCQRYFIGQNDKGVLQLNADANPTTYIGVE